MQLLEALEALEAAASIEPPKGARNLPPRIRYQAVLLRLKSVICPKLNSGKKVIETEKAALVAIIADAIILGFALLDIPAATIARSVAKVGVEAFCDDPSVILPADAKK